MYVLRPNGKYSDKVFITCAVTDKLNAECLLTATDYLYMLEAEGTLEIPYKNSSTLIASNDSSQLQSKDNFKENGEISYLSAKLDLLVVNSHKSTEMINAHTAIVNKITKYDIQKLDEILLESVVLAIEVYNQRDEIDCDKDTGFQVDEFNTEIHSELTKNSNRGLLQNV